MKKLKALFTTREGFTALANVATNLAVLFFLVYAVREDSMVVAVASGSFLIAIAAAQIGTAINTQTQLMGNGLVGIMNMIKYRAELQRATDYELWADETQRARMMAKATAEATHGQEGVHLWTGDAGSEDDQETFNTLCQRAHAQVATEIPGRDGLWKITYAGPEGDQYIIRGVMADTPPAKGEMKQ